MPELAEVAFFCRQWSPCIGSAIHSVKINEKARCLRTASPRQLSGRLVGNRLLGSRTHGKRMLFQFDKGAWLGVHLGMTGSLLVRGISEHLEKHDHLALKTDRGWLVFNDPRQFGKIELHLSLGVPEFWNELPLEIESPKFDYKYFKSILAKRKRRPLKSLLLVQDCFPGVGNWMADEILWKSRIRPDRNASSLSEKDSRSLFRALKFVCSGAMKHIALDYSDPPKSWLFQHRWKAGGLCPRTGMELCRSTIGGRTTCWSADWQK